MSDSLKEAATEALLERFGTEPGEVTRATLDVSVSGRSEIVTVALLNGTLALSSTGEVDGPHVTAALRFLAGGDPEMTPAIRTSDPAPESAAGPRLSWPPDEAEEEPEALSARARLADALDDVVTAIVRAGTDSADSPSVSESLDRLRKEAPLPCPLGLARWFGRLRDALDRGDPAYVARLLDGAAHLATALRLERPTRVARRRVAAWLGGSGELKVTERISDRTLIEVAREWLRSSERSGVERRYLVDVHNGEIFREERDRATTRPSIGPCPRRLYVGLAEVEDGPSPRRMRPMQYEVSLELSPDDLQKIEMSGYRRFAALADRYREQLEAHPGQAEPFAVVVPKTWEDREAPLALDDEAAPLPFASADDPAVIDVLRKLVPTEGPRWIAGRLVDVEGALMMLPCSVAVADGERTRVHRLR